LGCPVFPGSDDHQPPPLSRLQSQSQSRRWS
jgi:hypothetical protein